MRGWVGAWDDGMNGYDMQDGWVDGCVRPSMGEFMFGWNR